MRIIAASNLIAFGKANPKAVAPLEHWRRVARAAQWTTMAEVQATSSKAKVIGGDRARFDIGGGSFRLICAFDFRRRIAFVKFLRTHAEYDSIDARTVARF